MLVFGVRALRGQEGVGPLDHGHEEGLELLFLSQERTLGMDSAFQG